MRRLAAAVLIPLLLVFAVLPGVAAAQRAGGTVVVESGERVDGLTATGGTVIVRGTVAGDLRAYAGTVVVAENGTVTGRLRAYGGSVRIAGTVGKSVVAYAGSVTVERTADVGGSLGAAAGEIVVAGTVRGDVTAGASSVRVLSSARVTGDLNYDGSLTVEQGARIEGETRRIDQLDVGPSLPSLPGLYLLYGVLADLLLGAVLLRLFPDFSREVIEQSLTGPLRSTGTGLLAAVGVPVVLGLVALTVIGIPLALAGLALFVVTAWVASVYGRLATGAWVLTYTDYESVHLALVTGVVLVGVATRIPYLGWGVRILVLLVGLGPVALSVRDLYQTHRRRASSRGGL